MSETFFSKKKREKKDKEIRRRRRRGEPTGGRRWRPERAHVFSRSRAAFGPPSLIKSFYSLSLIIFFFLNLLLSLFTSLSFVLPVLASPRTTTDSNQKFNWKKPKKREKKRKEKKRKPIIGGMNLTPTSGSSIILTSQSPRSSSQQICSTGNCSPIKSHIYFSSISLTFLFQTKRRKITKKKIDP